MIIEVDSNLAGKRLDSVITASVEEEMSTHIGRSSGSLLSEKSLVNGKRVKRSYKLKVGDVIELSSSDVNEVLEGVEKSRNVSSDVIGQEGVLNILDEDDDFLVLYKPKGLVVHPGVGNMGDTLANYVVGYLERRGVYDSRVKRGGVVHRLDKGVSGVIVFAKTLEFQNNLISQFRDREVKKLYLASVTSNDSSAELPVDLRAISGQIDEFFKEGLKGEWFRVEGKIARDSVNRKRMKFSTVSRSGKRALTYIRSVGEGGLLISIETGRMHQIRATLRSLGYVIVGDAMYGYKNTQNVDGGIHLESVGISFKDSIGASKLYVL